MKRSVLQLCTAEQGCRMRATLDRLLEAKPAACGHPAAEDLLRLRFILLYAT